MAVLADHGPQAPSKPMLRDVPPDFFTFCYRCGPHAGDWLEGSSTFSATLDGEGNSPSSRIYELSIITHYEVRVRFSGFSYDQDEWVNVKRGVRKRSIPLEPSECHRVKVGDLVLCFRETDDLAIYADAYIVEVQRRLHDTKGCNCIFVVRYDYDNAQAKVPLTSICCRPM
ncbi:SAWADEE HOMEODOMAIN protein [Actinidia rufa]|uniref:SAWADEE HOMEODOMAIN protein n=1 Tax=Actinidia rufa TaxID=165716 RepID=A0A7J0GBA1_9ERIC|nr:SAWADEE HOMEODOMAIN protein [Actinidia rufa]